MAAPLNTCTTKEQRGVVRFLWAKDMASNDIHKKMLHMYGEHCLSLQALPFVWPSKMNVSWNAFLTTWLKEQCARGSDNNRKYFTPQVSKDL
jgi:hypothetical protein